MTDTTNTNDAILKALRAAAGATVAELGEASGLSRSTVGKALQSLEADGLAARTPGGREGGRRLPDRFEAVLSIRAAEKSERLRAGELRSLVRDDLGGRSEPVSGSAIAKSLGRSGGAVANALERLVTDGVVEQVNERPRMYVIQRS
ncbi:MAG: MarR family transcriptional regulator [Acidimicrobiales bacterium]